MHALRVGSLDLSGSLPGVLEELHLRLGTEVACESGPPSVEESTATEREYHENDDEQSSRVHLLLLCVSKAVLNVTQHAANANRRLCRWGQVVPVLSRKRPFD